MAEGAIKLGLFCELKGLRWFLRAADVLFIRRPDGVWLTQASWWLRKPGSN
jgi:hypothetical protein